MRGRVAASTALLVAVSTILELSSNQFAPDGDVSLVGALVYCSLRVKRMAETSAELGRLDILVNNAGGGAAPGHRVVESDPVLWAQTIALNLLGVYYVTHAALPHLIAAGGGKIVNVGSGARVMPFTEAYAAAKAGLWVFTQGLAMEVWEHDIDVNEVIPGPVMTRLTESMFTTSGPPPFAPSERVKDPEEPAELILWLVRQRRGGPTGQSFSLARRPLG